MVDHATSDAGAIGIAWRDRVVLFAAALLAYGIESVAWPITLGRDGTLYVRYFVDMWHATPAFPMLMLTRTPGAPLLVGVPLYLGGAALAEVVMGIAYAVSVVMLYGVALAVAGRRIAVAFAVLLLLYVPYGLLFHTLSSDAPFAFGLSIWAWLLVRAVSAPDLRRVATLGAATGLLILIRPPSGPLLLAVVIPLLVFRAWRRRALGALAFAVAAAVVVVGFEAYNDARYGDFTLDRQTNATFPFYGLFTYDKLVSPDNGPASRKLADAVRSDLLPREPYRSYRITLDQFFSSGSIRAWADLVTLSDRKWGWNDNYRHLRAAAIEAIRRHPSAFAHDVLSTVRVELGLKYAQGAPSPRLKTRAPPALERVGGRLLPVPSEGDIIPASRQHDITSTPDNSITWDWSDIASPHPVFSPAEQKRNDRLVRQSGRLMADLPDRSGSATAARWLNRISRRYPSMALWLIAGLLLLLPGGRRRNVLPAVLLAALALVVIVTTAVATPPTAQYRVPFDPVFILFGVVGIARAVDLAFPRVARFVSGLVAGDPQ